MDYDSISRGLTIFSEKSEIRSPIRSQNYIRNILRGECKSTDITNFDQYDDLFRLRHDTIHWLICEHRDIPFGEKHIHEFKFDPIISNHKYYKNIMNQSPDILIISGKHIRISELTVSRMKLADAPKLSKYQLLIEVLQESGYTVELEVIVINSTYSYPDHTLLSTEYGFTDQLIHSIYNIVETFDSILHSIHETNNGREWAAKRAGKLMELIDFGFSDEDVKSFHNLKDRKCFNSIEDLDSVLKSEESLEISDADEKFIDSLVDEALKCDSMLTRTQKASDPISKLIKHHDDHSFQAVPSNLKSFMPLPYFESRVTDSAKRSTMGDEEQLSMMTGLLSQSNDACLVAISKMKQNIDKVHFSAEVRYSMALEGPGRRSYIRKGSQPHIEVQNLEKRYWLPIDQQFNSHIEEVSYRLSHIADGKYKDPVDVTGPGLDYIWLCQSIFREICINASRSERRQRCVLKPTGVDGLFVFLNKGPKLRTGENISIIWFKIIITKEHFKKSKLSESWIFKTLHNDTNVFHSRWLSTDANRLDHYLRCYDKILMAYICYQSLGPGNLLNNIMDKSSNTLGIIIMIYMEDKRSTSKMLQDVRYLVMSCLSMFNYYADILKKFTDPIRTPLQSYLLSKIVNYIRTDQASTMILGSHFGKLNVEAGTGDTFDRYSGAKIEMPRILTTGNPINFKQMLCEMYFTMLFNKNQDDPTHASFQILSKILEGEQMLSKVKESTGLHTGFKDGDLKDLSTLITNPMKNQFSRRAIIIASKLQSCSRFNKANNGISHIIASRNHEINKTIDEFATYKSSSVFLREYYDPSVRTIAPDEVLIPSDLMDDNKKRKTEKIKVSANQGVQNPRRRCIEGVSELINAGYIRSFDLIKNHLLEPFRYQIFKKNQIGGVREILILDIHKRILVNILESVSRLICRDDDREMLTHGDKKNMLIRDLTRHLKRGTQKRVIMNYNFDKTKWAPSFMPIQFLYMFLPFKDLYPSLFRFIVISLINHSNKEFILPERLVRVWNNDPENTYKHRMDDNLQKLKESYLETKKMSYINESNMGQGILHYTSSYFHLCVVSLRDEIYKRLCKKMNMDPGEWRDLVSSDDSYTAHALPMDSVKKVKIRIILFMKAQEITERVMNVWTSTSKSSISMLIYEFNSLFGSNLTMFPTVFKFALASVHPQNTDSFFRMTKEGYIASRQIVENGGSLELYMCAQKLNKIYSESIYHTHIGGQNAFEKFGLLRQHLPYQLGIYPIMDPGLMIMFGPECHNYEVLRKRGQMSIEELNIFQSMHTLVELNDPEIYSAINSIDDVFVGVNRIEARTGPIRRLEYIKRCIPLTWDDIQERIMENPLILFNKATDKKSLEVKVYMKLFQNSSAEALRSTAASIYYGRVAASVSANAFVIPFVSKTQTTYSECIEQLMAIPGREVDIGLLYPHQSDYEMIRNLSILSFDYNTRSQLETQNVRTLQLNKLIQRISNPIMSILNHFWSGDEVERPNSYNRDWINLRSSIKILKPTLEQTLDQLPGDRDKKIRGLLLIILRLMSYSNRPMKAIIFGPSCRSFDDTYLILKQQNMYSDRTSQESTGMYLAENITRLVDKLSYAFNLFALSIILNDDPISVSHMLDDDDINSFFMDNSLSISSYKKVLMMLIYHGHLSDLPKWSLKTKVIFHQWELRGKPDEHGNYSGNYKLKLQLGSHIMQVHYLEGKKEAKNKIIIKINKTENPTLLYELLMQAIDISGLSKDEFLSYVSKGNYLITSNMILASPDRNGIRMDTGWMQNVEFNSGRIEHRDGSYVLYDNKGTILMKTVEGLLHTNYIPEIVTIEDKLSIQGIPLTKLIKFRPFNTFFSIESINPQDLLFLIRNNVQDKLLDLHVNPPRVSHITNIRLNTNYPERRQDIEFSDVMIDPDPIFDEEEKKDVKEEVDIISSLMMIDDEKLFSMLPSTEGNFHDVWLTPDTDLNLLKTMTRQRITYQPKKILERITSIKYQIISRLITNINLINKRIILDAKRLFNKNKNITHSLVYVYDSQFSNTETPSPSGCEISINSEFDMYYFEDRLSDDSIED